MSAGCCTSKDTDTVYTEKIFPVVQTLFFQGVRKSFWCMAVFGMAIVACAEHGNP